MNGYSKTLVVVAALAAVCLGVAIDRLFLSAADGGADSEAIVSRKVIPAQKRGVASARKQEFDERAERIAALKAERNELLKEARDDKELSALISELKDLLADELTPVERKMVKALDAALEREDSRSVRALVREARKIGNVSVRKIAVASAGWLGEEAMPELEAYMADDDPEVAEDALSQWELALEGCENEAKKLKMLEEVLLKEKDEGTCDYLSIHLITCENADLAVKTIENLISSDNSACKGPAKESYEWITGREWGKK